MLTDLERADLARFMHEKRYSSGETVFARGEYGNTMLVVAQGALAAVVPGKDGVEHAVAHMGPGSVLGEMYCIDPAPRPVKVLASEPTVALELRREDLTGMRQQSPRAAAALVNAVLHEVLRRLRSVDDRVERELLSSQEPTQPDALMGAAMAQTAAAGAAGSKPWQRMFDDTHPMLVTRSRGSA
jgi:CRP-like cAMP-binding protein